MSVPFLTFEDIDFPCPDYGISHHDGLVAISADLQVKLLLNAYRLGIFPWFSEGNLFYWFATAPRAVLDPNHLHIGRSLRKTLRHCSYRVSVNRDFMRVMQECAQMPRFNQNGTWITPAFIKAYNELHQLGYAHSFECYMPDLSGNWILAGGMYGVQIGCVFYGESMFHLQDNASKIALVCAAQFLAKLGVKWIDCQQYSSHTARLGAQLMPFDEFSQMLKYWNNVPLRQLITSGYLVENVSI